MSCAAPHVSAFSLASLPAGTGFVARPYPSENHASKNALSQHETYGDKSMNRANGLNGRSVVGLRRNKTCAIAAEKNENQDWLAAKIASLPVSDVVAATGMSETAVQNVRRGKSKLNFDNMTSLFKAHPELGAEYMEYIGLLLPGQAEMAAAYTRFANAAVRGK